MGKGRIERRVGFDTSGTITAGISTKLIDAELKINPFVGEPPPSGRHPIGDSGFYKTPDVISVFDKENYPDSPFNGGNPFSITPIGVNIGVSVHPCGFDVDAQVIFAFIKGGIGGLSYRIPGACRQDPDELPPPPPPPPSDAVKLTPPKLDPTAYYVIAIDSTIDDFNGMHREFKMQSLSCSDLYFEMGEARLENSNSTRGLYIYDRYPYPPTIETQNNDIGTTYCAIYRARIFDKNNDDTRDINVLGDIRVTSPKAPVQMLSGRGDLITRYIEGNCGVWEQPIQDVNFYPAGTYPPKTYYQQITLGAGTTSEQFYTQTVSIIIDLGDCKKLPKPPDWSKNPPPPLLPKRKCCMSCCEPSRNEDDLELLKKILKKVENLEKRIGVDEFPFKVPASLRTEAEGWLASKLPKPKITIENVLQFQRYNFLKMDEIIGEFDINIEIVDADPTKPGDQPEGMKIANVAEGIGEMTALSVTSAINSEVTINMLSRLLYEIAALRQTAADSHSKADALIKYFGFKVAEKVEKMPSTFTAGTDKLDEMLVTSEVEVVLTVFDDDKNTYKHDMAKLLQAADIVKGTMSQKVNARDATEAARQISERIRELHKTKVKMDEEIEEKLKDDFDRYCELWETGAISTPGIDDADSPYGDDYANRPRVIRLDRSLPPST